LENSDLLPGRVIHQRHAAACEWQTAAVAQLCQCVVLRLPGSGQVRFITRPKSRTMRAKRKKTFESQQNECAQMSNELESDSAMLMNLESPGVDGAGYDETETEPPSSTNPQ
jgi:hypothetical protein